MVHCAILAASSGEKRKDTMQNNLCKQLAIGAAAGLVGTMAIQTLLKTHSKFSPRTMSPIRRDPGEHLLHKARRSLPWKIRKHIPRKIEATGGKLLGVGYGMAVGAVYATARRKTQRTLLEGALLGLATWAVAYLGWLPGAKLMKPVWKHKPAQAAMPLAEHALYGIATVGSYRWLKNRVEA